MGLGGGILQEGGGMQSTPAFNPSLTDIRPSACTLLPSSPPLTPLIRVINTIQTGDLRSLFNTENTFISKDGGGAGNNWASGFTQGEGVQETLLDMMGECAGGALRMFHTLYAFSYAWSTL